MTVVTRVPVVTPAGEGFTNHPHRFSAGAPPNGPRLGMSTVLPEAPVG
jgi:hypothetical protein